MKRAHKIMNGNKAYTEMTTEELRAATREFDRPTRGDRLPGRPLTTPQRARFERARQRGRPQVGQGAKPISLTVELGLLKSADRRAKSSGITRAELFARALRDFLAKAG
jgi:hypothetical protein